MRLNFLSDIGITLRESGYRIIVTGAGGWLGLATLEMLEEALGEEFNKRVVAIASRTRTLTLRSGRTLQLIDFAHAECLSACPTLMAHYAFLTRDKVKQSPLSDYVERNRRITSSAVALAEKLGVEGVFVTSSGAVYEKDGSICRDLEKNPYGFLKAEEERAFIVFSKSKNVRLSLCRLFNLSGPFIHKEFDLNSILLSILDGKDIDIRARHAVIRDYIHVRDLVSLGFAMMLDTQDFDREPFDSGIGSPIEIGDLTKLSIEIASPSELQILRGDLASDSDRYIGDVTKIRSLFSRYNFEPSDLSRQILDTANYLITKKDK